MSAGTTHTHESNGATKERLRGDEREIERLVRNQDDLFRKHDDFNVRLWRSLAIVAGLIIAGGGGFATALLSPINQTLTRHDAQFETHKRDNEQKFTRIADQLDQRRNEFPTQFEYKEHVKNMDAALKGMDEFRARLASSAIMRTEWETWKAERGKVLDGIQRGIDMLERRTDALSARINAHELADAAERTERSRERPK